MTTRKETIVIPEEACVIWDILVDFEKYPRWRENVNEVKMIDEKHYQEFNREGYQTMAAIEKLVPLTGLKLSFESESMAGYREFLLSSRGKETEIEITEGANSKGLSARPVGKSVSEQVYLQRKLKEIIDDLKRVFFCNLMCFLGKNERK